MTRRDPSEPQASEVERASPARSEPQASEVETRGVHNPRVVDLIRFDSETDRVVLLMLEERAWDSDPDQLRDLEAKFNSYLSYVLDGHLVRQYPQYEGKLVRFELDCATEPGPREQAMFNSMRNFAVGETLAFEVNVIR